MADNDRSDDMTTVQYDLPHGTIDSAAIRGLRHLPPEMQWQLLVHLVSAVERGKDRLAAAFVHAVRRYENGPPTFDMTNATTYTWEEWQAEFGSGVSASDESGGHSQ